MKKHLRIFIPAVYIIAACYSFSAVAQSKPAPHTVAFVIPSAGANGRPVTITSPVITFDKIVSNLYPGSSIDGVNIISADIISSEPSKKDLSIFKSIKIYLCRKDGSNPVLLASRSNISKNAGNRLFFDAAKKSGGDMNTITASQISSGDNLANIIARLPSVIVSGSSANIRGKNTNQTSNALFVLDNVTIGTAMPADLDVNNIKSVKVLKEPIELSQYGIQGSNGVILIETKRGVDTSSGSGSSEDSSIHVRLEYVLRDELKSEANLNVMLAIAD